MSEAQDRWPDSHHPGMPQKPEIDGHHLILIGPAPGQLEAVRWSAETREWWLPGATLSKSVEWAAKFCRYVSPVRTDADLRAAYQRGLAEGRRLRTEALEAARAEAAQKVLDAREADTLAACRKAAATMREKAAQIAMSADFDLLADSVASFRAREGGFSQWHRRLHAEAIHDLPLPGEDSQGSPMNGHAAEGAGPNSHAAVYAEPETASRDH